MTDSEKYLALLKSYISDFTKTYALIPNRATLGIDVKYALKNELDLIGNKFWYHNIQIEVDFDRRTVIELGYSTIYHK